MTNREDATTEFEVEIWIDAAPDVVFPYFIDQDKVARWLATSAKFDVRPGGSLRFVAHNDRLSRGKPCSHFRRS